MVVSFNLFLIPSKTNILQVESYKQENKHWLSQLNDTQREFMELRSRLTEQKALCVKQLAEKDGQIEQMRSVINNLKVRFWHTLIIYI